MRHFSSILSFIFITTNIYSQIITFERLTLPEPHPNNIIEFEHVSRGSVSYSDIDNDNDFDVLITGYTGYEIKDVITKLYLNDGNGNYYECLNNNFTGIGEGTSAFVDINGDNNIDIIISGKSEQGYITKLYVNDGNGKFIEKSNNIVGVINNAIAISDVDGDNDSDLLISGESNSGYVTKLYINNGDGYFEEDYKSVFIQVSQGDIEFADIDNDNDEDVLIVGRTESGIESKLYKNNGKGIFSEVENTSLIPVMICDVEFSDIDNDNDQDIIISGFSSYTLRYNTKLYINDGNGNYEEVINSSLIDVNNSSITFSDVDGDNDEDLLVTGNSESGYKSELYINNNGDFIISTETKIDGIEDGNVVFFDVDGDNDSDLLISGESNSGASTKLYINEGANIFLDPKENPILETYLNSSIFLDIDGDNSEDLLITGRNNIHGDVAILYRNDGKGNFYEVKDSNLKGVAQGDITSGDLDGDTDIDLLITGVGDGKTADIYFNNGEGIFSRKENTTLIGVFNSTTNLSDIDNDGDLDIFITGSSDSGISSNLYKNDGQGNFIKVEEIPFDSIDLGSVDFADIDGDGDEDLLITGSNWWGTATAKLYTNDGNGNFTEKINTPFIGVYASSIKFFDMDGDTDNDAIITGNTKSIGYITKLYENDGKGNFSEVSNTPFQNFAYGSISIEDINGDKSNDILLTGNSDNGISTEIYLNDQTGKFRVLKCNILEGVAGYSSSDFSDIDMDGDIDVFIAGQGTNRKIAHVYNNIGRKDNSSEIKITECDSYTSPSRKYSYSKSGIYIDTIPNYCGTDSVITIDLTINYSDSVTDIISSCGEYTWMDGITYSESNYSSYQVLKNKYGCDSIIFLDLTVNTIDTTITQTGETLTANETDAKYQWIDVSSNYSPIENETSKTFTVKNDGIYAVEITKNECTQISEHIEVLLSLYKDECDQKILILPNPSNGDFVIKHMSGFTIKIVDMKGTVIHTKDINNDNTKIKLNENIPSGIYIIRLTSTDCSCSKNIIIE